MCFCKFAKMTRRKKVLKNWNVYKQNTTISMIILLRVVLSVPVQIGMKKVKKNNKKFLNLEKSNKKKSCLRKIVTGDGTITANPKTVMSELELYYSNLYSEENSGHSPELSLLDDLKEFPTLTEELRNLCEGNIEYNECFKVLQSFQTKLLVTMD